MTVQGFFAVIGVGTSSFHASFVSGCCLADNVKILWLYVLISTVGHPLSLSFAIAVAQDRQLPVHHRLKSLLHSQLA